MHEPVRYVSISCALDNINTGALRDAERATNLLKSPLCDYSQGNNCSALRTGGVDRASLLWWRYRHRVVVEKFEKFDAVKHHEGGCIALQLRRSDY
jgi:hypothetical protein